MLKKLLIITCIFFIFIGNSTLASTKKDAEIASALKQKIGQMLIVGFEGKSIDKDNPIKHAIEEQHIGGVILFDYNYVHKNFDKNIESPFQVRRLNQKIQELAKLAAKRHHNQYAPLLISVDYEGGQVTRLQEQYGFPKTESPQFIAQQSSTTAAENQAEVMANTLKINGFNLNFTPLLDVAVDPDNPIIAKKERSFSADPTQIAPYASIYAKAFRQQNILCAFKHFPGHGSSTGDTHKGFVDVSDTWNKEELIPYQTLVNTEGGCDMVMSAHIVNRQLDPSGLPATLSHKMLTDYLRGELQFKGVIITDDMQMKAISDNYGLDKAVVMAINAGADMLIFGNNLTEKNQAPKEIINIIYKAVQRGNISKERIETSFQRIIKLKEKLRTE